MKYFALVAWLLLSAMLTFSQEEAQDIAWIRGGNLSEDVATIDILVNGEMLFSDIAFTEITDYISVPVGAAEITMQWYAEPQGEATAFEPITVPLSADETYFFGVGGLLAHDTLDFIAIPESIAIKNVANQNPAFADFSFDTYGGWIFLHGVSQGDDLSVGLQTGETIIPRISFPGLYATPVSQGRFPILAIKSDSPDEILFNQLNPFSFNPGVIYLTAAVGSPDTPQIVIQQAGTKTLAELTTGGELISQMSQLLGDSHLADALATNSSYTLFVPTNDALENAGIDIDALMNDPEARSQFIENHTFEGNYTLNELSDLDEIVTLNGKTVTITRIENDTNLLLNDTIALNFLGIQALNGVIYLIDDVIE